MIAQEDAQLVNHPRDRALGIAIDAVEGRARMGIEKSQSEPRGPRELLANRDISVGEVAATLGVDRSTLYRALARKEKVMPV
jgi:transcriptional regulator of acetoin/glycerol metabolism